MKTVHEQFVRTFPLFLSTFSGNYWPEPLRHNLISSKAACCSDLSVDGVEASRYAIPMLHRCGKNKLRRAMRPMAVRNDDWEDGTRPEFAVLQQPLKKR
jgi:hypothetical protein